MRRSKPSEFLAPKRLSMAVITDGGMASRQLCAATLRAAVERTATGVGSLASLIDDRVVSTLGVKLYRSTPSACNFNQLKLHAEGVSDFTVRTAAQSTDHNRWLTWPCHPRCPIRTPRTLSCLSGPWPACSDACMASIYFSPPSLRLSVGPINQQLRTAF